MASFCIGADEVFHAANHWLTCLAVERAARLAEIIRTVAKRRETKWFGMVDCGEFGYEKAHACLHINDIWIFKHEYGRQRDKAKQIKRLAELAIDCGGRLITLTDDEVFIFDDLTAEWTM